MNYLHQMKPPIVHRDLKSPNLLVDDSYTVKVIDRKYKRYIISLFCYKIKYIKSILSDHFLNIIIY
jgi:serine/threonine protein kinase